MKRHILSSVPVEVRFVTICRGLVKCSIQPFGVKVNLLTVNHRSVCLSVYVPQAACLSVCLSVYVPRRLVLKKTVFLRGRVR